MNLSAYNDGLKRVSLNDVNQSILSLGISQAERVKYVANGVLHCKQLLSVQHIAAAMSACEAIEFAASSATHSYGDVSLEAEGGGWKAQDGSVEAHAGAIRKVSNIIDHDPAFLDIAISEQVRTAVAQLIGGTPVLHSKGFLMNKPPEVSSEKPWHQDGAYFDDVGDVVTAWIPLQDVDEENGCLQSVPGSQTKGHIAHKHPEAQISADQIEAQDIVSHPMKVRDVLLMDKNTLHRSGINTTDTQRRALIFRYTRLLAGNETPPNIAKFHSQELGGGVSPALFAGEEESVIEKRHLIINRVLRQEAIAQGKEYYDLGTDYHYPFYDNYTPTQNALHALSEYADEALHYPSSYGLSSLRASFSNLLKHEFGLEIDSDREIMINTGASQAFDAISRAFDGDVVLTPQLSLPTVGVISRGNGAHVLRLDNNEEGFIDLDKTGQSLERQGNPSVRFLYLNSPCNPTGRIASKEYLSEVVAFAKENTILILHDMDSWHTSHKRDTRATNILEVDGAMDCAVTSLSLSKEFGLSGLRVGLLAGNPQVINTIRVHNSVNAVMIPEVCQYAAQAALNTYLQQPDRSELTTKITHLMETSIDGWKGLGWPDDAIVFPEGGFKYMVKVPPSIRGQAGFSSVELFDYFVASRGFVKLSTSRSFNPDVHSHIRVVIMQNDREIDQVFQRLQEIGISYDMNLPLAIGREYSEFIHRHISHDF
ncbi:MAG: aminotransferase class I/II-fold pyridoxal phosphate-dependent enzyme [bacterium]|nr:aminotransferase class I/II-fold pyridoxal phosphate-dependent enzyme [bacterium]